MGGEFRVLHLVRQFLSLLREVQTAHRKVPFREKVIYTMIALFIFLACSQLPLYGIHSTTGADPFYWMRVILASNRGTVMELGITPIITSGLVVQCLSAGSKIFQVEDRALLNGAQKLFVICITVGQAVAYVLSGMYGSVDQLGVGNAILIIIQLSFGGIIVICLDPFLQKGYGLGSAISLFIATNTCGNIIWKAFSPTTVNSGLGAEFEGAVMIFLIVLLPLRSKNALGLIKLFYTSMPILHSNLVFILYFISQFLYHKFTRNFYSIPVGGIAYYITAPYSLADMAANPFHALFYLVIMITTCALFSKTWIGFLFRLLGTLLSS